MRYFRLYLNFLRFSFSKALQFRLDFTFRIFMDVFFYIVSLAFFKVIYLHTELLGGWTEQQVMVFVAVYLLIDAVYMTMFSENMWWLPQSINNGELDYYLVRPVSTLFFVSLRSFAANSLVNLVMAVGIFVWALARLDMDFAAWELGGLIGLIALGSCLHYFTGLLFVIPVFWTHSGRGLSLVWFSLTKFMERPDSLFFGPVRFVLTTLIPLSLMASFPARIFFEGYPLSLLAHMLGVGGVYIAVVLSFWMVGLRAYSSASS